MAVCACASRPHRHQRDPADQPAGTPLSAVVGLRPVPGA